MASSITFHPILDFFLAKFQETGGIERAGARVGNMDELILKDELSLEESYLVCAGKIHKEIGELIRLTGPKGALLAASSIKLTSQEVIFEGDEDNMTRVVGLEGICIKTTVLKLQNVAFYVLGNAPFRVDCKECSMQNVHLARMHLEGTTLKFRWQQLFVKSDVAGESSSTQEKSEVSGESSP